MLTFRPIFETATVKYCSRTVVDRFVLQYLFVKNKISFFLQILSQRIESAKTLMRPRYNSANKMNADDVLVENTDDVGEEES